MTQIAVIGAGMMGEALLAGLLRAGHPAESVLVGEKRAERAAELTAAHGVRVVDNLEAAAADTILLVVKPQDVPAVLGEIAPSLRDGQLLISVAAGVTIAALEALVPEGVAVVRVMPNTPALVGQGMAALSPGSTCTDEQLSHATELLAAAGRAVVVPEKQQDAVTAVSGSGPAYVFLVAEAMIDAGVRLGLPRPVARELTVQTLLGAATMLSETGEHPAILRENVTSPGGTTAAALATLEAHGLRAAFLDALAAAHDRSVELGS
ncbi:pyrroline-5-carboxylate reductase [Nocardioides montaniterrae]